MYRAKSKNNKARAVAAARFRGPRHSPGRHETLSDSHVCLLSNSPPESLSRASALTHLRHLRGSTALSPRGGTGVTHSPSHGDTWAKDTLTATHRDCRLATCDHASHHTPIAMAHRFDASSARVLRRWRRRRSGPGVAFRDGSRFATAGRLQPPPRQIQYLSLLRDRSKGTVRDA